MKKFILILVLLVLVSCEKEFKTLQRSYVISNFIELNDDLDYKLIYYCDKYSAFEHFYDIKHTIFNEIGEHNYYKSAETRMAIVSHTKDTGTCQFQHKTFYYLANKYKIKGANLNNEIGEHNYYKSAETRMSIVSHTLDTGTCQFQHKTFYYLANKYNLNNKKITDENAQIAVMVLAFKDGRQNLWYGYKKYKNSIE